MYITALLSAKILQYAYLLPVLTRKCAIIQEVNRPVIIDVGPAKRTASLTVLAGQPAEIEEINLAVHINIRRDIYHSAIVTSASWYTRIIGGDNNAIDDNIRARPNKFNGMRGGAEAMGDGWHPSDSGYTKMANLFF